MPRCLSDTCACCLLYVSQTRSSEIFRHLLGTLLLITSLYSTRVLSLDIQFLIFRVLSKAKGLIRLDGSGVFESKFVDSKTLYFRVESLCWNAQFHRGPVWTRNSATSFGQGGFDHFFFLLVQHVVQCNSRITDLRGFPCQPRFIDRDAVSLTQDYSSFNHVLKLSDIARPTVIFE